MEHRDIDIEHALESTRVLREPDRRIDTFADTRFDFSLLTEPMDEVGRTLVRDGRIEAGRPKLITPDHLKKLSFEGFGEQAEQFAEWLGEHGGEIALVRYGFNFRKTDVRKHLVHEPLDAVRGRVLEEARAEGNPLLAVIEGVEDAWEISLLKFSMDLIQMSQGTNLFDWKRKGLI